MSACWHTQSLDTIGLASMLVTMCVCLRSECLVKSRLFGCEAPILLCKVNGSVRKVPLLMTHISSLVRARLMR